MQYRSFQSVLPAHNMRECRLKSLCRCLFRHPEQTSRVFCSSAQLHILLPLQHGNLRRRRRSARGRLPPGAGEGGALESLVPALDRCRFGGDEIRLSGGTGVTCAVVFQSEGAGGGDVDSRRVPEQGNGVAAEAEIPDAVPPGGGAPPPDEVLLCGNFADADEVFDQHGDRPERGPAAEVGTADSPLAVEGGFGQIRLVALPDGVGGVSAPGVDHVGEQFLRQAARLVVAAVVSERDRGDVGQRHPDRAPPVGAIRREVRLAPKTGQLDLV